SNASASSNTMPSLFPDSQSFAANPVNVSNSAGSIGPSLDFSNGLSFSAFDNNALRSFGASNAASASAGSKDSWMSRVFGPGFDSEVTLVPEQKENRKSSKTNVVISLQM